ncbi:hypothetical protein [Propionivibrio sp.]|uniref:hypothetical protein n=1 Tax=Propionivibrio sp. TaxID=2212460 RepID=UPI003BF1DE06
MAADQDSPGQPVLTQRSGGSQSGFLLADNTVSADTRQGSATAIPYVSGGIGDDDPLANMTKDYNLHLIFATQGSGEYLADIKVVIEDSRGNKVLAVESPGPVFYAKLPAGNYRISADYQGKSLHKSVAVKAGRLSDLYFHWPSEDVSGKNGRI